MVIILNYDRTSIGAWTHDREGQPFFTRLRMVSDPDLSLSKNRANCFMGDASASRHAGRRERPTGRR